MYEYNKLSDRELYGLLAHDNEDAFTLLYQRYWKRLIYKSMLKLESHTDAEEVVQDAFIDLWNSRHRIQIQHSFPTYIAAVVKYKVMARMASNKKLGHQGVHDIDQMMVADNSTQEWLNFSDLQLEIEAAVQALPEKCQLVFRMSREDGLSDQQIAESLDLSKKTVEAHISKALRSLRKSIRRFFALLPDFNRLVFSRS
ncbi:RNA polymerase sigma-70 factor [Pedobacter sp. KBW06]|uniref:RNA polymerase sigma-70 factor n=1 Tax=Pedobacter sp. KBW06 TaxID=2153359 RepID=UPI000F5AF62C|nr:RNA polymerase sigma-70 factor [Pedobacter sp. KBW06]RQO75696.1 RNA polymerase sigma-70 factor [Pedobacter sp. KBW06]